MRDISNPETKKIHILVQKDQKPKLLVPKDEPNLITHPPSYKQENSNICSVLYLWILKRFKGKKNHKK